MCFQQAGTEVLSLLQVKGTTEQAQNLALGRDGQEQPVKIRDGTRDGAITIFLSKAGTGQRRVRTITLFFLISCFIPSFPVLKHTFPVLEHPVLF